jgi:hypothetical protein
MRGSDPIGVISKTGSWWEKVMKMSALAHWLVSYEH